MKINIDYISHIQSPYEEGSNLMSSAEYENWFREKYKNNYIDINSMKNDLIMENKEKWMAWFLSHHLNKINIIKCAIFCYKLLLIPLIRHFPEHVDCFLKPIITMNDILNKIIKNEDFYAQIFSTELKILNEYYINFKKEKDCNGHKVFKDCTVYSDNWQTFLVAGNIIDTITNPSQYGCEVFIDDCMVMIESKHINQKILNYGVDLLNEQDN